MTSSIMVLEVISIRHHTVHPSQSLLKKYGEEFIENCRNKVVQEVQALYPIENMNTEVELHQKTDNLVAKLYEMLESDVGNEVTKEFLNTSVLGILKSYDQGSGSSKFGKGFYGLQHPEPEIKGDMTIKNSYPGDVMDALTNFRDNFEFKMLESVLNSFITELKKDTRVLDVSFTKNGRVIANRDFVNFIHHNLEWVATIETENGKERRYPIHTRIVLPNDGFLYPHFDDLKLKVEKTQQVLLPRHPNPGYIGESTFGSRTWNLLHHTVCDVEFKFLFDFAKSLGYEDGNPNLYYNFSADALDFEAFVEPSANTPGKQLTLSVHKGFPSNTLRPKYRT